jgi:hypothetical protein
MRLKRGDEFTRCLQQIERASSLIAILHQTNAGGGEFLRAFLWGVVEQCSV